jgi:hypothetical protein
MPVEVTDAAIAPIILVVAHKRHGDYDGRGGGTAFFLSVSRLTASQQFRKCCPMLLLRQARLLHQTQHN